MRSSHRNCLSGYGVVHVTSGEAFKTSGVGVVHWLVVNCLDDFAGADTVEKARRSVIELGNILRFCGLD